MNFPLVSLADWRAQVEKELAGVPFEKALAQESLEGFSVAPLYTEGPAGLVAAEPAPAPFKVCTRHERGVDPSEIAADLDGGADALWMGLSDHLGAILTPAHLARLYLVLATNEDATAEATMSGLGRFYPERGAAFALTHDPIGSMARGESKSETLSDSLKRLGEVSLEVEAIHPRATTVMVSTLPYHDAGADAADEIAIALSTGAVYLRTLIDSGFSIEKAATQIALQMAVGRETFHELCKLRALRICWEKLLIASGIFAPARATMHGVCSSRTLSCRDPWVNMLRVSTQVFAAVLGGADLVTPNAFDRALGSNSALGRRLARNTGLILREESFLGRVSDPAGGSYYLDTLTNTLAREAWGRFRVLEREGGVVDALKSGRLAAKLEAAWTARFDRISKRKVPILGVSEFANLGEVLPSTAPSIRRAENKATPQDSAENPSALPHHRDAERFEELRSRADALKTPPEIVLLTLGSLAESRARAGFAAGFFTAGGIRARESTENEVAALTCLCGTDERYASEAIARAQALKAAGCDRVLMAGRPGGLEPELRAAGVDGFVFVGCDAVAVLSALLENLS